ncbi:hypothetical protein N9413_12480, partial [Paracoccaceae bacterium]|nr:hypothetical protein [Paracoccaceae bacterium]
YVSQWVGHFQGAIPGWHKPRVYYRIFKPLQLCRNQTSDLRRVVLGSQFAFCLPTVLEISL